MALSPAERERLERELAQIRRERQALVLQEEGDPLADEHVEAVAKPRSGFSPSRAIIGTGRDIIQNVFDFAEDAGDTLEAVTGFPIVRFGKDASNGVIDVIAGQKAIDYANRTRQLPSLPQVEGSENAPASEKIVRSIAGYLVPYVGWSKVYGVAKAATFLGRSGRAALAGATTTLVNQDPQDGNIANVIRDTFGVDQEWLDTIASDEDEQVMVQRLKAAATDAGLGVLTDGVFQLGGRLVQLYKGVRGEADEAKQIVEAIQHDYAVKKFKQAKEATPTADELLGNPSAGATPEKAPFDPTVHVGIDNQPETWEDILALLTRAAGDAADEGAETLEDTIAAIAHGDPDNVLTRAGINPKNLDWSAYETPEAARRLHAALTDASEQAARGLGRTGTRVPDANLFVAARSLASDVEVLKAIYGRTSNLPEILTGARMLVGSHANVLIDSAEEALEALLKNTSSGPAWDNFLRVFHRHAMYVAAVRGAGSELGRALRSLRTVIRSGDKKTALKEAEAVADKVKDKVSQVDPKELADDELNAVLSIETDAERIALLNTLLDKGGDIGELAQFVRQKNGSALRRIDDATRETMGNLFSQATAAFNVKSGFTFLGMRSMARWMAVAARLGLAPFSRAQRLQARVAFADAWAYTDGVLWAWKDAVNNTLAVLEKEGASELFVNADNLGLAKLAKAAASAQARGVKRQTAGNFERVDLITRPKAFALTPADRRALNEWVESYNLPRLMERGLKWMARTGGAVLNAAGTLQKVGTILFINAPDQFIGTMAARAGAQAAAVREGARQAAELGLEGKELSRFLRARVASLSTDVSGWADESFEEGFREAVYAAGEHEAREILFQDPLELTFSRKSADLQQQTPGVHIIVPFVHTPLRILERTAFDFTPIGLLRNRFWDAIRHGTPQQREQALAQMALGTYAMAMAYKMAEDRGIVGMDGSFYSTSRLSRDSYTMRIGADVYEFKRDDPIGTLLGFAADLRAYLEAADNEPEKASTAEQMFIGSAWAATANMLSKTWLQSVRNLVELATALTDGEFEKGLKDYTNTFARRFTPGAGIQKGIQGVFDEFERDAATFFDNALKVSIGASTLPIKRDFLGRPIDKNLGERFIGLTWEPEKTDPLSVEFERLSFRANMPSKTYKGVRLTAQQYNRLLQIRGEEVTPKDHGLTLQEALTELFGLPEYHALRKEAKVAEIRKVFEDYTKAANEALLAEDPVLAAKVMRQEAFEQGRAENLSDPQIEESLQAFATELGLTPQ